MQVTGSQSGSMCHVTHEAKDLNLQGNSKTESGLSQAALSVISAYKSLDPKQKELVLSAIVSRDTTGGVADGT